MTKRKLALAAAVSTTAAALLLTGCGSSASTSGAPAGSGTSTGPAVVAAPVQGWLAPAGTWGLAPDMSSAAAKARLQMLGQEMLQVHYHAHLDVIVDGKAVTVPAYIGIDNVKQTITALHTHQTDGIIHIESAQDDKFTLAQVFTEWGQSLTTSQVGPVALGSDKAVHLFVNGKDAGTDASQVVLHSHDEVVVWVGAKTETPQVPASFAWDMQNYPQ